MSATAGVGADLRSDAELIASARTRDAGAFGTLYERHAGAALVVARQHTDSAADADDVVADAFTAVWNALQRGTGPTEAFRAYLFTVVRRVATQRRDAGRRTQPTDDVAVLEAGALPEPDAGEPALAGFERSIVAKAFASLPERWQAVLWHSEVEGLQPAQIAPLLGLTANSTAALAYRAREGLRQAYLQQHLQEPLADGCRAVAGKLGAFVRNGLGARDNRAVEAHLDECGRCRALVLELGDVSHGMRGVIAPLVLGLAGLGALGHTLPVGGGLAAGWASLAAGPVTGGGAAGGGATAGAGGATGGGAAAAGAAGEGAAMGTGAGGAAGAGAAAAGSGAAGVGGVLAGVGGLLAALPTALVAAIAAVVVVVAGVVGGIQLFTPSGSSTAGVEGGSTVSTDSADGSTGSTGSVPVPSPAPAPAPAPTSLDGTAGPGGAISDLTASSPVGATTDTSTATGSGGTSTGGTTSTGTTGGTTDPSSGTTTDPVPPPAPAQIGVVAPADGFTVTAGSPGNLAVDVTNTGGSDASGLVADVTLPDGVALTGVDTSGLSPVTGRFAPLTAVGWLCGLADGLVHCVLDRLPAGMQTQLAVTVAVDESYTGTGGTVTWEIAGAGLAPVRSSVHLTVAPAPARLVAGGPVAPVQLVVGRTTQLAVPLLNAGGTATSPDAPAVVDVTLPAGVTLASWADPWTCTSAVRADGAVGAHCTDSVLLGARESTTLVLGLVGHEPSSGWIVLRLGPTAGRTAVTVQVGCTVVVPAQLTVTADVSDVPLALGHPADLTLDVRNVGGDAAASVVVTLTRPAGATWADPPAGTGDWTCAADAAGVQLTCTRASLAAGAGAPLPVRLVATPPSWPDVPTALRVTAEATGADAATPLVIPATVVRPLLHLGANEPVTVLANHAGTVDLTVGVGDPTSTTVQADADAVTVTVTLPPGVHWDNGRPGTAVGPCTAPPNAVVVTCALGRVAAGSSVHLVLPVTGNRASGVDVTAEVTASGATSVVATRPLTGD